MGHLGGGYHRRGGPFVFIELLLIGVREGFGNCFGTVKFEDLDGGVYITSFFCFRKRNYGRESFPRNLADQHFLAKTLRQETVDTQTAKAKEVKFRRRGESPHSYPSHHSPFVICFHRAMDRSLGRDSRRGNWSFKTVVNKLLNH
jgi:hypothetical protein